MIRPVDRFTLDTGDAEATARSVLRADGRALGTVRGTHLDAQFAVGENGFVLFISFDDIFSAIETIYFVGRDGRILDEVRLGHETEQGLITDISIEADNRIRFAFPLNETHVVRVARESRMFGLRQRWLHLDS